MQHSIVEAPAFIAADEFSARAGYEKPFCYADVGYEQSLATKRAIHADRTGSRGFIAVLREMDDIKACTAFLSLNSNRFKYLCPRDCDQEVVPEDLPRPRILDVLKRLRSRRDQPGAVALARMRGLMRKSHVVSLRGAA